MTEENSMSNWFQDNLRIIISVGIVILLVFAIYSYSKRNSSTDVIIDDSQIEEIAMTAGDSNSDEINEIIDEIKDEENTKEVTVTIEKEVPTDNNDEAAKKAEAKLALEKKIAEEAKAVAAAKNAEQEAAQEQQKKEQAEQEAKIALEKKLQEEVAKKESEKQANDNKTAKDVVREVIESRSRQKEGVIVVVAVSGDSQTTLARKAAAEYISKNNVSGLTPAHKIYIEDYVRKATRSNGIHTGTEMDFSNDLISQAIEKSRTLSSAKLSNLDKYAANVSSF